MIPHDTHLHIGSLLFEGVDQIDLTGPFEVLSRVPNSTYRIYGKTVEPIRDVKGLRLAPAAALADAPPLDVLHVPGGFGQEALMEDAEVLGWIRRQASGACSNFSVCTGALICGAAGLLKDAGRRHTGRRCTCCRSSARSLSTIGWSSTAPGFSPPASRPGSMAPCVLQPSCAATKQRRRSSFIWPIRQSRPSTPARPKPRRRRYWRERGNPCAMLRRGGNRRRGASPPSLASRFQP